MKNFILLLFILISELSYSQNLSVSITLSEFFKSNQIRFNKSISNFFPKSTIVESSVSKLGIEFKMKETILENQGYIKEVQTDNGVNTTILNPKGLIIKEEGSSFNYNPKDIRYRMEKRKMQIQSSLNDYNPQTDAISFKGMSEIENASCYIIEVMNRERQEFKIVYYVNTNGFVIKESIVPVLDNSIVALNYSFSEFTSTSEGYLYPSLIKIDDNENTTIRVNSVLINPKFKPETFNLIP